MTVENSDSNWAESEFELAPPRLTDTQYFVAQNTVNQHATGGRLLNAHSYELNIMCKPGNASSRTPDTYTCSRFTWIPTGKAKVTIPTLADWSYSFDPTSFKNGFDSQGLAWGLPHSKFDGMKDNLGNGISLDPQYQIYSLFNYFHSFCGSNVVIDVAPKLKRIGDYTKLEMPKESPVNLGEIFLSTSRFIHGETTMKITGLSVVDCNPCAVLRVSDIGGGYKMMIRPMPFLRVKSIGATRYSGNLFVDLKTGWIRRSEVTVVDVTKTTMYGIPVDVSTMISDIQIKAISQEDYESRVLAENE